MTPEHFIAKWQDASLRENQAAHQQFLDLCELLEEPKPADADPDGTWYCFERGARKSSGGRGWADVWKRGHFAWEYKSPGKDLRAAFGQLQQYALALENPPLLVVSDLERFCIHTNWTNTVSEVHEIALTDLRDAKVRRKLKHVFSDPDKLRPDKTRSQLTEEIAGEFAILATNLRDRGHDGQTVAHFVNRLVFCMFAEDIGLLPGEMFTRMLGASLTDPEGFQANAEALFAAMKDGGRVGFERVDWFNGGLFDDDTALPLRKREIEAALRAAKQDWSQIDPTIFGTLFERGLDPDKRSQLGAHYTDHHKIMLIVEPVVARPWRDDWQRVRGEIEGLLDAAERSKQKQTRTKKRDRAQALYSDFLERLRAFRVLDPACGSGNFLYLALQALKDIEHRATLDAEALGLQAELPGVGPHAVKGVEHNLYAAELARVTIWIGEIQWMLRHNYNVSRRPILKPLDTIECRDAVLNPDGSEPTWPEADVVIGNPPFLGGKRLRDYLGDAYVEGLFRRYRDRVPAEADLVTYWFAKAWDLVAAGTLRRAGLVATNSIRGGANRRVLQPIAGAGAIYEAWDDEPWVVEGAAVRVAIVCFAARDERHTPHLDGAPVDAIHADLSAGAVDVTQAARLPENANTAFMGDTKGGPFDISGDQAREWLEAPTNPNGRPNSDVVRPWMNGRDVADRPGDKWIVDFGTTMSEREASLYEAPFAYIQKHVLPVRQQNKRKAYRDYWWRHVEPRPGLRRSLQHLSRYIATPEVSKHRFFVWIDSSVLPDHKLQVIAQDNDVTFGILESRFHKRWALGLGSWHGVGNDSRYTIGTTFETFPFPPGLTPPDLPVDEAANPLARAIGEAARRLNQLRENWLNPPDLVRREPEVVPGYPDRLVPVSDKAAKELKKRTLTKLYNDRPQWLADAHADLDAAVAAAYGWPHDIPDEDALTRLMTLNRERAAPQVKRNA
ncbi:Type II restriction/modification system, DNA methylase subunit YeeA [Limimonas halophila]|uniref:site-specific DNA-methyltransferase (adenine-specific) n=1 Tax=Limimonas halophila TaxID=1082479 RepID=A0A1G7QZ73_9PROT|nr:class I SAM-dependent DNA methyltransferase [Limimonas halophila]SDG03189.1 Type II restriction/modification system, DNA methylase subunit YeeA [Limimonas halophila]